MTSIADHRSPIGRRDTRDAVAGEHYRVADAAAVRAEDADGILVLLPADHLCADDEALAHAIGLVAANLGTGGIALVATPTAVVNRAFGHVRPGKVVASSGAADVAVAIGYVEKPE